MDDDKPPHEGMDELNAKALSVWSEQGEKEFMEHVFKNPKDNDQSLSYAQMRWLYG